MPRKVNVAGGLKVLDEKELPEWASHPEVVEKHTLAKYRNLTGTAYAMNKRYPDGWGDDELKAWIIEQRESQIVMTVNERMERKAIENESDQQVQDLVDKYLERFSDPTPNDMVGLREMARIELLLNMLNDRFNHLIGTNDMIRAKDFETLTKVKRDALAAFQQLEKSLGMDRLTREEETDVVSMFSQIKTQAWKQLEKRSRQIVCNYCREEGVDINYGIIVFHLDGQVPFEFGFTCPRCKKKMHLFGTESGATETTIVSAAERMEEMKKGWYKPAIVMENEP